MPLNQTDFSDALAVLFEPSCNWRDDAAISNSAIAFQNLAMRFIELNVPQLLGKIAFDPVKLGLMLKRFYRDAFGVLDFHNFLVQKISSQELSAKTKKEIVSKLEGLSIRINTDDPRKTRIAAAFSLWFATLRPISVLEQTSGQDSRLWRLEATINFWIAESFLARFGTIEIGVPGDADDYDTRIRRIWYDFTFRDLNLSSLELMYASIFRPRR
jgi:hypothetical protein